ncbi:hypothetical protein EW146_g9613 [Bondarzewia mesenterica]|uniref:DUF6699 domain-containing protein n=1 Tax=Bondarzewia mesenterica TaxID=1095465 RepID=A0A4S4L9V1_9AGAM|nr:hypothetical protein EW146_g9613 [Bondarzewia mesenterica]
MYSSSHSHSSKQQGTPTGYISSPQWSLNNLTGTTASSTLPPVAVARFMPPGPSTPVTAGVTRAPYPPSAGLLPSPASSAGSPGTLHSTYSSVPSTPGAPYMYSVPLPSVPGQYGLPTPPTSPHHYPSRALLDRHLMYDPSAPLNFNVVNPPTQGLMMLRQAASQPSVPKLVLMVQGLSWSFEVSNPYGLSVSDVLSAIYHNLHYPTNGQDYEQNRHAQSSAGRAFQRRATAAPNDGLRRVDFLGSRTRFAGLSKASDGTDRWTVHFV